MVTLLNNLSAPVAFELCQLMAAAVPGVTFRGPASPHDTPHPAAGVTRPDRAYSVDFTPQDSEGGTQRAALRRIASMLAASLRETAVDTLRTHATALGYTIYEKV